MKFGTAHGRSRPEVGSVKHIDVYGSRGVFRRSLVIAKYDQEIIANADLLGASIIYRTVICLLFVIWTNIYQTTVKRLASLHSLCKGSMLKRNTKGSMLKRNTKVSMLKRNTNF